MSDLYLSPATKKWLPPGLVETMADGATQPLIVMTASDMPALEGARARIMTPRGERAVPRDDAAQAAMAARLTAAFKQIIPGFPAAAFTATVRDHKDAFIDLYDGYREGGVFDTGILPLNGLDIFMLNDVAYRDGVAQTAGVAGLAPKEFCHLEVDWKSALAFAVCHELGHLDETSVTENRNITRRGLHLLANESAADAKARVRYFNLCARFPYAADYPDLFADMRAIGTLVQGGSFLTGRFDDHGTAGIDFAARQIAARDIAGGAMAVNTLAFGMAREMEIALTLPARWRTAETMLATGLLSALPGAQLVARQFTIAARRHLKPKNDGRDLPADGRHRVNTAEAILEYDAVIPKWERQMFG